MMLRTAVYYCLILFLMPLGFIGGSFGVTFAQEVKAPVQEQASAPAKPALKVAEKQGVVFLPQNNINPPPPIRLDSWLEKTSVPYDQAIVFTVAVSWLGEDGRYSLGFPPVPRLRNLKMVASSSENLSESSDIGVKYIKRFIYRFRARHEEPAEIGQVVVEYEDIITHKKLTVTTQAVPVTILPPEKDFYKALFNWTAVIAGVVFLLIIVYGVVVSLRRKKQKKNEPLPPSIEECAMGDFEKLEVLKVDVKEYYSGISRLLKKYLSDKYAIKTVEETTEKIDYRLLEIGFPEEQQRKVDKILSVCDSVKFAQYTPKPEETEKVRTYFEEILKAPIEITGQAKPKDGNSTSVYNAYYSD